MLAIADKQNDDTDVTHNVQTDNKLNQLIDDTTTVMGNKNVTQQNRGGKNNKRHHKNGVGRSHAKAQNNGEHFNGAQMQGESKSAAAAASKHHVNTFREFTVTEADAVADHTQTD